jgi:uncharacterized protein YfaP (DUF2135 family)
MLLLRSAVVALLALAACNSSDAASNTDPNATNSADANGWLMASGKEPSKAEFAAFAATCQQPAQGQSVDACFADLGLKRAP